MVMLTPTIHTITYLVLCIHISLISQVAGASSSCTAERRGYSTLLFSKCQDRVRSGWCYRGKDSVAKYDQQFFKDLDPEKFDPASSCSGFQTSCQFLRILTRTCGGYYKDCHDKEDRKSIMRLENYQD